ncbi:DNA cytosine methyltransferase [Stenotrophomonas sp. T8]|uniref:DNA cytosine methyltransferase n=1 Tax=Stenotrophomonas sp. T8 TaxID=3446365 RepID=UPI003F6F4D85
MADGSRAFNFPMPQRSRLRPGEIVVDLFAGGGGASEGLKQALGIDPALAYNHDELAIGMHAANHPLTQHHREDIWHADPRVDVAGRPIGWFHASPDCTHFSQAKGGQPRSRKTRALSWVVLKWVGQLLRADRLHGTNTAPRIISMENVWQILTWGPLVAKRCSKTGRVITLDLVQAVHPESGKPLFRRGKPVMVNRVADKGERVPVERQALVPHKRYSGRTWRQFVAALRALGYAVEWRKLVASDYGAGTSRERLFLLGRRDGQPIVWPEPTHGTAPGLKPRVTAADCLDFSIPCPSIFTRDRPLADATMRRIAKGVMRHVINSADPFIVPATHQGGDRVHSVRDPMRTITAANRGELMLLAPELAPFLTEHANASRQRTMPAGEPLPTVCAGVKGGHFSVVSPTLVQKRWGTGSKDARSPVGTVTASGNGGHAVAQAELAQLSPEQEAGALRVAAFLVKYYGSGIAVGLHDPVDTVTTKDRLALVTVVIKGTPYVIVDIGLRMLKPHELFRAQGFPVTYIIDRTADGTVLKTTAQVRMCGNSVSPPPMFAIAEANLDRVPADMAVAA